MKTQKISTFKEKPASKVGWWTFGLGVALVVVWPLLNLFAAIIRPLIDRLFGVTVGGPIGLGFGIFSLLLAFVTLFLGIKALRKGERSWAVWLGFVVGAIVSAFWIFMVVGELLFPH